MVCYKIISLKRKRENEFTEYLKYYLFPNKLVGLTSKSEKIIEFKLDNKKKVEEKFSKILKTKLRIGFSVVNDNIDPIFYNQFNDAMKGFDAMSKEEKIIRYRFTRLKDNDNNSFVRPNTEFDKKFIQKKYNGFDNLVNLYSTFSSFYFQIDINRDGMQFIYRFTLNPWDNDRWSNEEPDDKLNSELGKSVLTFITDNEKQENISFWSKVMNKLNYSTSIESRYYFFTKGLISFLDSKTEKIYSVYEYEPSYNKPVKSDDIIVHDNTVEFMSYAWNRLQEDIFYSMKYN